MSSELHRSYLCKFPSIPLIFQRRLKLELEIQKLGLYQIGFIFVKILENSLVGSMEDKIILTISSPGLQESQRSPSKITSLDLGKRPAATVFGLS